MITAFLIISTLLYLMYAVTWKTGDFFNSLCKISFILLTTAGISLLIQVSGISIRPEVMDKLKVIVSMNVYLWTTTIINFIFGITITRHNSVELIWKMISIIIGILGTICLISV